MTDLPTAYHEGVASHPDRACPYAYASELGDYCAWWAGWHDVERGYHDH